MAPISISLAHFINLTFILKFLFVLSSYFATTVSQVPKLIFLIININLSDIPYLFDRSLACGVWQGAFCFTYFPPSFPNGRIWCLIIISHFIKLSLTSLLGLFCYFSNFFLDLRYNNFNICNLSLVFTCAVT